MLRKVTLILIAILILLTPTFADEVDFIPNQEFIVFINGERVFFSDNMGWPMLLKTNRTVVPIRIVSEKMGYDVKWNPDTYQATISDGTNEVVLDVRTPYATVNGNKIFVDYIGEGAEKKGVVDTKSFIKDSRTYVPLRFIAEAFGGNVEYRRVAEGQHEIKITTAGYVPPVPNTNITFNPATDIMADGRMSLVKTREYLDYAIDQFKVTPTEFSFEAFELPSGFKLGVSFGVLGTTPGTGYGFKTDPILENQRIPVNESFTRTLDPKISKNANFTLVLTIVNGSGQLSSSYDITYEPFNKEFPGRAEIRKTNVQGGFDQRIEWDKNRIFEGL